MTADTPATTVGTARGGKPLAAHATGDPRVGPHADLHPVVGGAAHRHPVARGRPAVLRIPDPGVDLVDDGGHAPRRRTGGALGSPDGAGRARLHRRLRRPGHLPPQGLSRTDARRVGDPPPPARPVRGLLRPRQVRGHLLGRPLHPGRTRTQLRLRRVDGRRTWSSWWRSCAEKRRSSRARGDEVDTSDATLFQLGRALQGLTLDEARARRAARAGGAHRPHARPRCTYSSRKRTCSSTAPA